MEKTNFNELIERRKIIKVKNFLKTYFRIDDVTPHYSKLFYCQSELNSDYTLELKIDLAGLSREKEALVNLVSENLSNYIVVHNSSDFLNPIHLYTLIIRKHMFFSNKDLKKRAIELKVLHKKRLLKSRILVINGHIKEICMYDSLSDDTYYVSTTGNWLWMTDNFTVGYNAKAGETMASTSISEDLFNEWAKPNLVNLFNQLDVLV